MMANLKEKNTFFIERNWHHFYNKIEIDIEVNIKSDT